MKQRPMQTIMRRKPKPDQPVKSDREPKSSTSDSKVVKGSVKTSDTNSAGSSRKAETKKQEVEKPAAPPAPVEPPRGGHYELNARMTKMVENELRDIMIKVWQELPDNPTDEAECIVVDELRNNAGDDLRNVLGLNITKRLLNVHNPLYVKVQFSGKPEKVHLGEFLKKYNFIAFKRIEKTVNMFAAQVKSITDFDKICSASDVRCGDVKVIVNPIYRFTKCPSNLITSFKNEDDTSDETPEITVKDEKAETEKIPTPEKVTKTESVPSKSNVGSSKTESSEKLENQIKVESKPAVVNKPATEKVTPVKPAAEKKTPVKPADNKPNLNNKISVENKSPTENKAAFTKPAAANFSVAAENKGAVNKPTVRNNNINNKATINKSAVGKSVPKPGVAKKPVINKPPVESQVANKPVQNKATVNKEVLEVKKTQMNANNKDNVKKPVKRTPVKAQAKTKETNNPGSDHDELDDHDILALMSEGIILDECSGSDDE